MSECHVAQTWDCAFWKVTEHSVEMSEFEGYMSGRDASLERLFGGVQGLQGLKVIACGRDDDILF